MSDEPPKGMTIGTLPSGATNISGVHPPPFSEVNDGGPAFPIEELATGKIFPGMSLRDYFAAAALTASIDLFKMNEPSDFPEAAEIAYKMADAMIAQRDKEAAK
jgi:hypothetical protein